MAAGYKVKTGGVRPPSAPPAAGIRNNNGIRAQARGPLTQQALRNRASGGVRPGAGQPQKPKGPSGGVKPGKGPPGRFGNGRPTPLDKQRERERKRREAEAAKNKPPAAPPPSKPPQPTVLPDPYASGVKPDPRDENYYANKLAINSMFDAEIAALDASGQRAETGFNQDGMVLAEYNRQRKRNIGESRLGTGSAYGGNARREQSENDLDYQINEGRRFRDKADADAQRELERGRRNADRNSQLRRLETETGDSLADDMANESANSAGDAQPEADTKPNKPASGKNNQEQRLRGRIKNMNERIEKLRKQLANTKDPKKREQLQKQIQRTRKRRSRVKGKLNG